VQEYIIAKGNVKGKLVYGIKQGYRGGKQRQQG
jgi:hypothetical protein